MEHTNKIIREIDVISSLSKKVVINHIDSFYNHDIDSVMADYTSDSIIITLQNTYKGLKDIRGFITEFVDFFPKGKTVLVLDKIAVEDEVAYIVWHAKTPELEVSLGSGTFIIKNGKILQQTFIGQLNKMKEMI